MTMDPAQSAPRHYRLGTSQRSAGETSSVEKMHQRIRKQNLSIYDISRALEEEDQRLSAPAVARCSRSRFRQATAPRR